MCLCVCVCVLDLQQGFYGALAQMHQTPSFVLRASWALWPGRLRRRISGLAAPEASMDSSCWHLGIEGSLAMLEGPWIQSGASPVGSPKFALEVQLACHVHHQVHTWQVKETCKKIMSLQARVVKECSKQIEGPKWSDQRVQTIVEHLVGG